MLQFFPLRSPTLPPVRDQPFAFNFMIIVLSLTTFCLLSTFCCFTIAINCFAWFFTNIISGGITKLKEEIFSMSNREDKTFTESGSTTFRNMACGNDGGIGKNNGEMRGFGYLYSERRYVLAPAELSYKRCEKKNKSSKSNKQYTPDIPSPLNPKRQKDLKDVEYYPSERHMHRSIPKSELSLTDRMIESTAAYRVGKQRYGWQDVNFENCVIKKTHEIQSHHQQYSFPSPGQPLVLVPCAKPYDLCGYSEHTRDLNLRLDQDLVRHDRLIRANHSPPATLHARKCLDDLTASRKK